MSDLPPVGAEVVLEHADYDKSIDDAISRADELDMALNDLGGTVNANVEVDSSALTDLEDTQVDVGITVDDSELPFDEIPEETNTDVNLTETQDAKTASDDLHFMANLKRIETVIDIAGNVLDVIKDIGGMVVNPFLDVEDAVAKINAQTGGTGIADLGQFIRDIQAADLGTGVDQITQVVIAAKQLSAPIDEATTAALTFTHTFDKEDPVTVLTTLNSLVETGLVPNLQDAADLMTVAFQNSANKGNDLLNVVSANAQSWADMGLNGTQALSAINSLTQGNVDNATDAAKAIQTLDDALTTAADNADSPQAEALKTLGMTNPKDSGEAMGADFIDGFASSFANLPANQQDLVSGVLFGKVGKKFTGALGELTTQGGPFEDVKNAAADAATEIDNSLRGAINDFITQVNATIATLLSSEAIDLPGKIAALKEGFQEAVDVLAGGGTVGEALEVALNIPGLSDTLNTFIGNFERVMGNLEIIFLQIVASIQDITGHGAEATATRQTIASKSKTQLAFDLQLANADELPAMVSQALSRGLTTSDITTALETSVNESIAKADFNQGATIIQGAIAGAIADGASPEAANALAFNFTDKLSDGFDNAMAAGNLDLMQKMLTIDPNAKVPGLNEAVAGFQKQLSDAFAPTGGANAGANPFTSGILAPGGGGKIGATSNSLLGGLKTEIATFADDAIEKGNTAGLAFDHIATTADTMKTAVGTSLDETTTNFAEMTTGAQLMDTDIAAAMMGNTVTASFDAVLASADANFPGVIEWFERTAAESAAFDGLVSVHLRSVTKQLNDVNFLALQTIANVTSAQALGGSGPVTNNTTNNVTVNNNNSNGAQTSNSQYQLAQALGGG